MISENSEVQSMEKKREKKKQKQLLVVREKETESQLFSELLRVLEELEKQGKYVDVQVCPQCKSPRVWRIGTMSGDMSGHLGITPIKFECLSCGWRERLVLKATNRRMGWREVAIMAEAKAFVVD